jgi:hypothetical protein
MPRMDKRDAGRLIDSTILLPLLAAVASATPVSSTIALSTSANPLILGKPVTLTATVTPSTASGEVTFSDGVVPISRSSLRRDREAHHARSRSRFSLAPRGLSRRSSYRTGLLTGHGADDCRAGRERISEASYVRRAGVRPFGIGVGDLNKDLLSRGEKNV